MPEDLGVTNHDASRLGEFTWYSRLATWIGAAMLLAQSIFGRSAGPVTVLAVFLLGVGFLCFLIGLAIDSRVPGTGLLLGPSRSDPETRSIPSAAGDPARVEPTAPAFEPPGIPAASVTGAPRKEDLGGAKKDEKLPDRSAAASNRESQTSGRRPKFRERAKKTEARPQPREETLPEPPVPEETVTQPAAPHVDTTPSGVATEMLTPENVMVGAECPRCESTLRVGQLVATCPVCGRTHHAICWMENHFHCGTPDCTGHGSLEAPATSNEAER
jgi:hypothetical protein